MRPCLCLSRTCLLIVVLRIGTRQLFIVDFVGFVNCTLLIVEFLNFWTLQLVDLSCQVSENAPRTAQYPVIDKRLQNPFKQEARKNLSGFLLPQCVPLFHAP